MDKRARKRIYSFKIDPAMADALKAVKARDGTRESEQIRSGIAMYLKTQGVEPIVSYAVRKTDRPSGATPGTGPSRKRSRRQR